MKWLADFFKTSLVWVFKNPLLIVLVIVLSFYNSYANKLGPSTVSVNPLRADSIWAFTLTARDFFLSPHGAVLMALSLAATALLTMFNTGALFGVFGKKPHPFHVALRTSFSLRSADYFALQIILFFFFGALFFLCMWLVVPIGGFTGIGGSIFIAICTAVAYAVFYVILSTGSLILATPVTSIEQVTFAKTLFGRKNLPRLITFYLLRIGAEAVVVYVVLIITHLLGLPAIISGLIVVVAASVPFALVRTTGFVMKLDMLKEVPWFASYFAAYYQMQRATVGNNP